DDRLRIAVADTGPGIPADKLPRLFTRFDRLGAEHSEVQGTGMGLVLGKRLGGGAGGRFDRPGAEPSEVQGTGMGLVLAKRLAAAMGGALTVDSVEGQGTTFTLEL